MERTLLSATAAALFSGIGFITIGLAQTDQKPTHEELVQHWAEGAIDAQLKVMKTNLRLSADQEKNWGSFKSAVQEAEKARLIALQKEQGGNLSPMDRLNAKAERLAQSKEGLEKIVDAARPLYASLNEAQKHNFIAQGRMLVPERGLFAKKMRRLPVDEGDAHSLK